MLEAVGNFGHAIVQNRFHEVVTSKTLLLTRLDRPISIHARTIPATGHLPFLILLLASMMSVHRRTSRGRPVLSRPVFLDRVYNRRISPQLVLV